jgi:hypothetical protein
MGSVSAMESLNRVLDEHGQEMREEHLEALRAFVRAAGGDPTRVDVSLENNLYSEVSYLVVDGSGRQLEELRGPSLDIDVLAEEYPDCEVGY